MAPEPWLDLSTGVSPYAYPIGDLPAEAWSRLPEPEALRALEKAAALAYRASEGAAALAAPGSQAIIGCLPYLWPARRVGILGHAYRGHSDAWRAAGAEVDRVEDLAGLADRDVAIVVNPNNPDGRLVPAEDLHALARELGEHDGLLIVDEAFMDFVEPAASIIPAMPTRGVLALRSFGKAYGLAGLRLGFVIAPVELAKKLRAALGPWPVSGAAIALGAKALADADWLATARRKLTADAAALDEILLSAQFEIVGGSPLFRLAAHRDALKLFDALARAGILVRRFASRPALLRFGLPGSDADRARLRAALSFGATRK